MESLLNDLRSLLDRQVENLKILEEVLGRQRDCLVKRDVQGIVDSISEQEQYLERIQRIETDPARLVTEIAGVLGIENSAITFNELSENLDPDVGAELRGTGDAIRETLDKIGRVNRENKKLIERSLDFVHDMLGTISGKGGVARTYEASGNMKARVQERTLVDRTT